MSLTAVDGMLGFAACIVTAWIIIRWWVDTRGSWMKSSIGRSIMSLLAVTMLLTGRVGVEGILPGDSPNPIIGALSYSALITSVIYVGVARRAAHVYATSKKGSDA